MRITMTGQRIPESQRTVRLVVVVSASRVVFVDGQRRAAGKTGPTVTVPLTRPAGLTVVVGP